MINIYSLYTPTFIWAYFFAYPCFNEKLLYVSDSLLLVSIHFLHLYAHKIHFYTQQQSYCITMLCNSTVVILYTTACRQHGQHAWHYNTSSPWSDKEKIHETHRWKGNWTFLGKTCFIFKHKVISCFELVLNDCVFSFQGKFYKQLQGAAMASPVSPVIGNIYMVYFEELALGPECPIPSPWWKRYVDDVTSIVKKN